MSWTGLCPHPSQGDDAPAAAALWVLSPCVQLLLHHASGRERPRGWGSLPSPITPFKANLCSSVVAVGKWSRGGRRGLLWPMSPLQCRLSSRGSHRRSLALPGTDHGAGSVCTQAVPVLPAGETLCFCQCSVWVEEPLAKVTSRAGERG